MSSTTLSCSSTPKPPRTLHRTPSDPITLNHPASPAHQQIYVLSADGSSLFLLDPSKPAGNEEPPPYAPFRTDVDVTLSGDGPSSPRQRPPSIIIPEPRHRSMHETRHRASTLSESAIRPARPIARNHNSFSHTHDARGTSESAVRSAISTPSTRNMALDERTPLLARGVVDDWVEIDWYRRRGLWRAIFCGEMEEEDEGNGWGDGWKRFWRPMWQGRYWKAMAHLCFINFPFALFVWPPLVAGTLAGTALLITLPIGAAVWWLTLFIARSAARLETVMQLNYHSPLRPSIPQPKYHPIFYRAKERAPTSPISPVSETPPDLDVIWEKRFITCSYAMFCDHYSYSALSYFLLIKPLITLFSTILLWALFPIAVCLIFGLPMYLRAARRWGQWQAGIAIENL